MMGPNLWALRANICSVCRATVWLLLHLILIFINKKECFHTYEWNSNSTGDKWPV